MKSFKTIMIILSVALMATNTPCPAQIPTHKQLQTLIDLVDQEAVTKLGYQLVGGATIGAFAGSLWAKRKAKQAQEDKKILEAIRQSALQRKRIDVNIDALTSLTEAQKTTLKDKIATCNNDLNYGMTDASEKRKKELLDAIDAIKPISQQAGITQGGVYGCIGMALLAAINFLGEYFIK